MNAVPMLQTWTYFPYHRMFFFVFCNWLVTCVTADNGLPQLSHSRDSDFHGFSSLCFLMQRIMEWGSLCNQTHHYSYLWSDWFFTLIFRVVFDIISERRVKLKWLMFKKHKRWFHSSRVKFPLVSMSASRFLVSMYLIWIFGSKLIRSSSQSRPTLWVLETCLFVGLLPLMIILITAS